MQHLLARQDTRHAEFLPWVASQRPGQHYLVRCEAEAVDALARQVASVGTPPVRVLRLPAPLHPPDTMYGTLIIADVHTLGLREQVAWSDWLAHGPGDLRIIAVTPVSLPSLVDFGLFLEGLFHRLSAVQFDLTRGSVPRDEYVHRTSRSGARHGAR